MSCLPPDHKFRRVKNLVAAGFFVKFNGDQLSGDQAESWYSSMTNVDPDNFVKNTKIKGLTTLNAKGEDPTSWVKFCSSSCDVLTVEKSFLAKSDGFVAEYETHVRSDNQGRCVSEVTLLSMQVFVCYV